MKIFDLHADTIWKIYEDGKKGIEKHLKSNDYCIDVEKLKKGNVGIQTFAIYNNYYKKDAFNVGNKMIDILKQEINDNPKLSLVRRYEDFEINSHEGKISVVMSLEDASTIENSLEKLQYVYNRGVRMIGLNHNYFNEVCYPNYGKYNDDGKPDYRTPDTQNGLTEFGFDLIKEMNKLGIVVDMSHSSDKGFYDAIKTSTKPIMCSHSNSRAVCSHVRNLTDDMLYKLADNGGVTGMNFAPSFLNNDRELGKNTCDSVVEHVKYISKLIGIEYIALGGDFDGLTPDFELQDCSLYPKIPEALHFAGFTDSEIEKVCYKNALRVFRENMK